MHTENTFISSMIDLFNIYIMTFDKDTKILPYLF